MSKRKTSSGLKRKVSSLLLARALGRKSLVRGHVTGDNNGDIAAAYLTGRGRANFWRCCLSLPLVGYQPAVSCLYYMTYLICTT